MADTSIIPADEAQLAEAIRAADGPLSLTGGGTRGMAPEGRILSLEGLTGIVDYVPAALTLIAKAGTPLAEVNAALAQERQRLAFEPPDWRAALETTGDPTIGGIVAANLSGPRAVTAATPRDHLLGLRFVDGGGTVVKSGGRVMKNVTGLDLARLVCGSRGRLGAITEVALKVLPMPEATATLAAHGLDAQQAVTAMSAALATPWEVTGAARTPDGTTYLRIEGFAESVAYRQERLLAHLGKGWEISESDPWPGIRDIRGLGQGELWLLRCRPSDAAGLVVRAGAERSLMDLGGARLVLAVAPGTDLRASLPGVPAVRVGRPDAAPESPGVARLSAGLKARFDPRGLFGDH
ncbi:FAD-binding protein [Roseicyclus sp. F158]|uniref:FAD-binding protein n=1 Tax=Tropicimonas omnivorans TaxID=3075590 RepID=A0ABU3DHJ1_9RHOB|nr:FAD-binding protein [Roseicyclus sp. F158]MDT0683147.1 FAD-binding protein [Roseicyclus sp. F158]